MKLTKDDIGGIINVDGSSYNFIALVRFREVVKELKEVLCQESDEARGSFICATKGGGITNRCYICNKIDELFGEVIE